MAWENNPKAAKGTPGSATAKAVDPAAKGNPLPDFFGRLHSSALALVMANLVPVYGVLALGWKVAPILVFYWTENLVVGFFNVLKMSRAQGVVTGTGMTLNGKPVTQETRKELIVFFAIHYGGFTLGHGLFVMFMFNPELRNMFAEMGLALLVLTVSHGISYMRNFIGRGEYLRVPFTRLFLQPYARVFVMHLTIIAGGALADHLGSPLGMLLILVGLKTLIDLVTHRLERKKFSEVANDRLPI